jgi:HTH-type transcriptional repressor of NAD biosynthesis genes
MKQFKHGMVLGKFYPLHNGHLYLIDSAIEQCEFVSLFICTMETETISGKLRHDWLYEIYKDNPWVDVIWVDKILPQHPDEYGDVDGFYKIWCDVIDNRIDNSYNGKLEAVFTSETYGDEFASYLNVEHVLVDLPRLTHSVSGTSIRNNPIENWKHIPDVVKPYFKKKVVIMGTESTGKSTLTKKLSDHFKGDIVQEFGRDYTDVNPAKEMTVENFETIAITHKQLIDSQVESGEQPLIFIDTEALTTYVFGQMYLGFDFESKKIIDIILEQKFDLVLLCDIDVPWIDDGTRDFPDRREEHLHLLKSVLRMFEIPFKMIRGDYEDRFRLAKKYVNEI